MNLAETLPVSQKSGRKRRYSSSSRSSSLSRSESLSPVRVPKKKRKRVKKRRVVKDLNDSMNSSADETLVPKSSCKGKNH